MNKDYLIILPCSKRKKDLDSGPAIELYDGPFYQILRKHSLKNFDVLIISAKYGLISSYDIISNYDLKMTNDIASRLAKSISKDLTEIIVANQYKEIFINLGQTYMLALGDVEHILKKNECLIASGQIGERMHQFKEWLNNVDQVD